MLYLGIAAAVVGLSKLHAAEIGTYDYSGSSRFSWSLAYVGVLALAAYGVGLPDVPRTRRSAVLSAVLAAVIGALAMAGVTVIVGDALLPRFVVFGAALVLVPWYLVCVNLALDGRALDERRDRVAVVADRGEALELQDEVNRFGENAAEIVATLGVEEARAAGTADRPLEAVVERLGVSVLVLDRHAQDDPTVVAQAASLHAAGVRVRTMTLFYEEWLGKLPAGELERVAMMFDIGEVHRARYTRASRLVDLVVAVAALPLLAAITPVVWLGNRIANRGPLLYRQTRVGKGGDTFEILKFRTMRPAGPSQGRPHRLRRHHVDR